MGNGVSDVGVFARLAEQTLSVATMNGAASWVFRPTGSGLNIIQKTAGIAGRVATLVTLLKPGDIIGLTLEEWSEEEIHAAAVAASHGSISRTERFSLWFRCTEAQLAHTVAPLS